MPRATTNQTPLVFRGPPGRLRLHSSLPAGDGLCFEPDKKLQSAVGNGKCEFKFRQSRKGGLKKLKVRLNPNTSPGTYHASLQTSEATIPVDIEVEQFSRLEINPLKFSFTGKPGEKASIEVQFSNKGNVPITISATDSVGIYDDNGIETAFASTYRMDSNDIEELFGNFIKKLRGGHGGLLKLRLNKGKGRLDPGTSTTIQVTAQLPSKLKAGHNYHGLWSLGGSKYTINVSVIK